jgi:hypothetical protein
MQAGSQNAILFNYLQDLRPQSDEMFKFYLDSKWRNGEESRFLSTISIYHLADKS